MNQYVLPDIPRLYTALAEWAACMIYIIPLKKRYNRPILYLLFPLGLLVQGIAQMWAGCLPLFLWIPGMIFNLFLMFIFIYISCSINKKDAWYCCARAFITAEFASSLEWQFYLKQLEYGMKNDLIISLLFLIVYYGLIFFLIYLWETRVIESGTQTGAGYREVLGAILMMVVVFSLSNIGFITYAAKGQQVVGEMLFLVRTVVDFCGICVLNLQQKQRRETVLKRELEAINSVLHLQYEQYKTFQENNQIISRKYHDLKHQIQVIRMETDPQMRDSYLKEMDDAIKRYEAENVTGNGVLDTILTGKSMICASNEINMTCVADGHLLEFLEVMDICTIFGNALDNAIEHVKKIPQPQMRLIRVAVHKQSSFLIICFENYCCASPDFEEGIPKTTKKNSSYHGYGLKSIRYTAEKYNGTMTINLEQDWFILRLLIPLPETSV